MSWYHEFDGGRAWYTNMGHTEATFSEPLFLKHLSAASSTRWARSRSTTPARKPEENRFTKVVLAEKLDEPVELAVLPGERVLFIERQGDVTSTRRRRSAIKTDRDDPRQPEVRERRQAEDGLLGLAADPNFATQRLGLHVLLAGRPASRRTLLARFTMKGDSLDLASKKILLEIPTQREKCCHTGGSIAFDRKGNLFISTGDNTNPLATGYAPIDERPAACRGTRRKSSANTNDLRGKIIRIHPEPTARTPSPREISFRRGRRRLDPRSTRWGTAIRIASRSTSNRIPLLGRGRSRRAGRFRRSAVRAATTKSNQARKPATTAGRTSSATTRRTTDDDFAT